MGLSPLAVTETSDFTPALSKGFLDVQATIECGFALKRVRDMIRTYNPVHHKVKYSQKRTFIWPVGLNA